MILKAKNICVAVEGKQITSVCQDASCATKADGIQEVIDLSGLDLYPGLIDIHVHGGNGFDIMDCSFEAVNEISKFKVKEGVTTFFPTTVTAGMERTFKAIDEVVGAQDKGVDGAKIGGIFLEGPYIAKEYKGAHPENFIRELEIKELDELLERGKGLIKSIAISPEKKGAKEAIQHLAGKGVNIRIGHSGASYEVANEAIEAGANVAIHTFNAMSQLMHRSPNMVGAILTNKNVYAELICDYVHVHPAPMQVLLNCKKDKVVLITDCMCAGGLKDGVYMLGELEVTVKDMIAKLTNTETIAGSTLNLLTGVKNLSKIIDFDEAIKFATEAPAKALNIFDKVGSIEPGKQADLIGLDENKNLKFVMIDGKIMEL